ncbi:MAG: aminotransferase class I/II-fold pyridoxal phosphate-dependent enzyme, partial [Clostridia bacterium]|nr:aminotransferase class I/II-fold pyridoxal phosphate-dependent enzyme [Clostridia bacterium]
MRNFAKSKKIDNVSYDIRGPVLDESKRMEANGIEVLKLNIGNPAPFNFKAPDGIVNEMANNLTLTEGYSDSKGIIEAREAIVEYCKLKNIPNVGVNDIYTGNGASELITMAMQGLLDPGDEVLVPMPDYPLWTASVTLAGGTAVHYLCDEQADWNPDIDDIKKKITPNTKGIVIINPNNPTGTVLNKEQLSNWVDYARKNGILILFDAAYESFVTEPGIPKSIFEIDGARECAVEFRSFSKTAGFTGTRCA